MVVTNPTMVNARINPLQFWRFAGISSLALVATRLPYAWHSTGLATRQAGHLTRMKRENVATVSSLATAYLSHFGLTLDSEFRHIP